MKFRNLRRFITYNFCEKGFDYDTDVPTRYCTYQLVNDIAVGYMIEYSGFGSDFFHNYHIILDGFYYYSNKKFSLTLMDRAKKIRFEITWCYNTRNGMSLKFYFNQAGELIQVDKHFSRLAWSMHVEHGWLIKYNPDITDETRTNTTKAFYKNGKQILISGYRSPIYKLPDSMLQLVEKIYAR